ncbi:hypothetical protein RN001_009172 [Aquatica leii]|uniref:DNA repair protein RAD50 n=1 Tax=Aquatica leii TaxID=1421715 RepID=A0AAN7P8A1_9COLE|nr:hypothetical protein RN001_009172 [Aquatica leii]
MATVEELTLFGLRSFTPEEEDKQTIQFASPLTLFLGENGCGKTTIIEALKYALSGDLPGGSNKGQGFVNDPKLSDKTSAKGQVCLSIVDANKNKFIVTKSVKVHNKGARLSFERLDSTLKKENPDGTFTTIISNNTDTEKEVCEILGVSKAILNNVIFCHQEDAAWPLEEPKKLKEKFDEIFGCTEYDNCVDIIVELIKKAKSDMGEQASSIEKLKQKKCYADSKKSDSNEKKEKKETLEKTIKENQDRVVSCENRLQEICDLQNSLRELKSSYTEKETLKNALADQQKNILDNMISEFRGSDQKLQNEMESFERNSEQLKNQLKSYENEKGKVELEQNQLRDSIYKAQIKLFELQAAKTQHESTLSERNDRITKAASELKEVVPALDYDERVLEAINILQTSIVQAEATFQNLVSEFDQDEKELQEQIEISGDKIAKAKYEISSKHQQISDIKNQNNDINSQLKKVDYSDEQLKSLQLEIIGIEADLKKLNDSFDPEAVSKKLDSDKQQIRKFEEDIEVLEQEHRLLLNNNVAEAELEKQKCDIDKREAEIHRLQDTHSENLNTIFGDKLPSPGFIKNEIEKFKQRKTNELATIKKEITIKQKETTTKESKCRSQKDKLRSLEKELEYSKRKVFDVCQNKPLETECTELWQVIDNLRKREGLLSSEKIMYEKFVSDFQKEEPCCPLCKTDFTQQQSATNEIIRNIQLRIADIPKHLQEVTENLKLKEEQYSMTIQLKPVNDRISELEEDIIPNTKEEKNSLESECERVEKELNDLEKQFNNLQKIVDICNKVISDAALIDQQQVEINNSKQRIIKLKSQIVQAPSKKSWQQIDEALQENKLLLLKMRRKYETSQTTLKRYNDNCQQLHEKRRKHVEKLEIQKLMQEKLQLQRELIQKEYILNEEVKDLEISLELLESELAKIKGDRESARVANRKILEDTRNNLYANKKYLDNINKLQSDAKSYLTAGVDQGFETTLRELTDSENKTLTLKETEKQILNDITEVNKQLANQDRDFRNLKDNLHLRETRKKEETVKEEIDILKIKIKNHNYETILEEKKRLESDRDLYSSQINQRIGAIDTLQEEIDKLETELESTEFKNAHGNYKEALIRYTVTEEAWKNMNVFLADLERTVSIFHQERMKQINEIIAKRWRAIYRGNDCDYIKIQIDEIENRGSRRKYNYKVVQIKSDVEIEMRGRCSAGQKVLACLVIRMALAETFSKNCGILALDEPTTNLDRSNIHSLSTVLARVVNSRQEEKNFQLLIITHDEEFLRALKHVDKVDYFWKVTRNENGNSVVTKEYDL